MSKNVLIISGSPRKGGNSDILCDEFLKGVLAAGNKGEKVFLGDKKIAYCSGCEYCHAHKGVCVHKDDMAALLDKMAKADTIVMATPVYFYTLDAQIKTFMDRTVARYTELKDKEFYFILTAADTNKEAMARTVECFRGFTDCLDGAKELGVLYGLGVWKAGEVKNTPLMKQAFDAGKKI